MVGTYVDRFYLIVLIFRVTSVPITFDKKLCAFVRMYNGLQSIYLISSPTYIIIITMIVFAFRQILFTDHCKACICIDGQIFCYWQCDDTAPADTMDEEIDGEPQSTSTTTNSNI